MCLENVVIVLECPLTKVVGKPYEGEPHVRFDVAGDGDVAMGVGLRATAKAVEEPPNPNVGAPSLDPTRSTPFRPPKHSRG